MNRTILLCVVSVFLFSLISISSFAYQEFNYNPVYARYSIPDGLRVFDSGYNTSGFLFWQWNTSYQCFYQSFSTNGQDVKFNNTNCLDYTIPDNYLILFATNQTGYVHTENISILNITDTNLLNTFLFVPSNKEILVHIRYNLNTNASTNLNPMDTKVCAVFNNNETCFYPLNVTANQWINRTFIIPSTNYDRSGYVYLQFHWTNIQNYGTILIKHFKVFTLDVNDVGYSWIDANTDTTKYCGLNWKNFTLPSGSGCYKAGIYQCYQTFRNGDTGFLLARTEEGINCSAFKLGNITIGRRILSAEANPIYGVCYEFGNILYQVKDGYFINYRDNGYATGCDNTFAFFLESQSVGNAKLTTITSAVFNILNSYYNGVGGVNWTKTIITHNNSIRELVNLNLTSNVSSGTLWHITQELTNSSDHAFFNYLINCVSDGGLRCDPSANEQYYINPDCSIESNSYQSCGYCGCKIDLLGCDFPSLTGSYCDTNDLSQRGFVTTPSDCSLSIYGLCPLGSLCSQFTNTPTNTIACYNITSQSNQYCVNSEGDQVSCPAILQNTTNRVNTSISKAFTNPMDWLASGIGSVFSISDLPTAKNVSALFLSPIFSLVVVLIIINVGKGKIEGSAMSQMFIMSCLVMLIMFTATGWLSPLFLIVIIIVCAGIIVKYGLETFSK